MRNLKSGRAYIPNEVETKGFLPSHSIGNYGWIFEKLNGESGYVIPK